MFFSASVTDILSSKVDNNQQIMNFNTLAAAYSSSNLTDEKVHNEILLYPKTKKTIRRRTCQMKSSIITDKSKKLKQFAHLNHSSTSKSDSHLHIESDNDVCFDESSSSNNESIHNIPPIVPNGSFVVTKLFSHKSYKNFIAQIISEPDEDNDYARKFSKRLSKAEKVDLASTSHKDFVCVLLFPSPVAQTSSLSNIFKLSKNLTCFNVA